MAAPRWWVWALAGAVVLAGGAGFALRQGGTGADPYLGARVERGAIKTSIAASGTLQAVLTVQVGSQVTGRIQSLHADFNSIVRKGQVIARIDPATFDAGLVRARADLEDARAGLATTRSTLVNQQANLEAARLEEQDADRVLRRSRELAAAGVVSDRDLEASEVAFNRASAHTRQALAQVEAARAAIEQAGARVKQAQAQVELAQVNLDYTVITSPVDGVVVSRSVDVGQTVAASLQAPTLFVIANDLTRMQVVANVDEADIGQIGPEADVTFTVDSFPGETFQGTIDQIRLNPIVTQNVVTYSVIVNVDNPELKLRPGMTAATTFTIAETDDALRLPNAALRFWPPDVPRSREGELLAAAFEGGERPPGGREAEAREGRNGLGPSAGLDGLPMEPGGRVLRFPQVGRTRWKPRVVWLMGDDGPRPKVVRVGITDGTASEVMPGDLEAGDVVVTGAARAADPERPNNPFSPTRPRLKGGGGRRS
ncbi:MAG TPA: efflux RND transporter periplasmic adaptor subunit [Candidatus Polarisedimenticolia bacterium]|nr:efflux RND transporter periplasmic adaptor subunit [Candidatus Polarisedimenticolia bacterium]